MNLGKTLFAQSMEFVPWSSSARIVARYSGDTRVLVPILTALGARLQISVKTHSRADCPQPVCPRFGSLSFTVSLVQNGHIAGATLDVFRQEPLAPTHPFWQEPRITITPHISAATERAKSVRQIAEKIRGLERGETIAGLVDRSIGY